MSDALPKVALVSLTDDDDPVGGVGRLAERVRTLRDLGPALGLQLSPTSAAAVRDRADAARTALSGAVGVWWCGRIAFRQETRPLWEAIRALAPDAQVCDHPDHVEETFDLRAFYPRLRRAGVPQAHTRFVRLPERVLRLPEPRLRRALRWRLRWRRVRGGVFVRTHYGTRKIHAGLNIAETAAQLVDRATDLVESLRDTQPIGGLALRELLPITSVPSADGRRFFTREYRVFVVDRRPILWSCDASIDELLWVTQPADRAALSLDAHALQVLHGLAERTASVFEARVVCVDLALLDDGRWVVLEVNPGHCSGWGPHLTHAAVYGRLLRALAGLPPQPLPDLLAMTPEQAGLGQLYGVFDGA